MKLITYNKFIIHSHFSVVQITSILENMTANGIFKIDKTTPFIGKIHTNGFKITSSGRCSNGMYKRNSFKPVNIGKYKETESGADIVVIQRMDLFVTVFLMFWTAALLSATITILFSENKSFIFIPIIMILVMVILVTICFNYEAKKNRDLLREALQ